MLRAGFDPAVQVVHARDLGDNPTDLELWTDAAEKDADCTNCILALDAAFTLPFILQS